MKTYWGGRSHLMYYNYIDAICRGVAADCRSAIDVGSADARYLERFDWIPHRDALDIKQPYSSPKVRGIEMDFFAFEAERRYDVALCLQVLEHIPDARAFAEKLFSVADRVLISVPYRWPANSSRNHVHDPVDLEKLTDWTGRQPSYHIVVEEPLGPGWKGSRLIAYYHPTGDEFRIPEARESMQRLLSESKGPNAKGVPPGLFGWQDRTVSRESENIQPEQQKVPGVRMAGAAPGGNIFVLSTGRCGSTTFAKACEHMTNFTAGHQTRSRRIGSDRLAYPAGHIEVDNRLTWYVGSLRSKFPNARYVHLLRDPDAVARSYNRRWPMAGAMVRGWKDAVLMGAGDMPGGKDIALMSARPTDPLAVCRDFVDAATANIQEFLRDKDFITVEMENAVDDFSRFWSWAGAEGGMAAALREWEIRYNASPTEADTHSPTHVNLEGSEPEPKRVAGEGGAPFRSIG